MRQVILTKPKNLEFHEVPAPSAKDLSLTGSMMYKHEDFETAVEMIAKGDINLEPFISNKFSFEDYDKAYKFIDENHTTAMKVIINLDK